MNINNIHVYIGFGLSRENVTAELRHILQQMLAQAHFRGELHSRQTGLMLHTNLPLTESTDLAHRYKQVLDALEKLYAESDEELPEIWRVPMAASIRPLAFEGEPVSGQLPSWVLGEFGSALVLDSIVYEHQKSKELFQPFQGQPSFYIWNPEVGSFRQQQSPERQLRKMRNVGPEIQPQKITVEGVSIEDLPRLASIAYADVEETEQIGGRGLLLSFSLEHHRQHRDAEGSFTFYNATALGLKYQIQPNSLADHLLRGTLRIETGIAEPSGQEKEA